MLQFAKKSLAAGIVVAFSFVICGCNETITSRKETTTTDTDRDGFIVKKETTTETKVD